MMDMGRSVHVARSFDGAVLNIQSRCLLGFASVVALPVVLLLFTIAATT